MTRLDFFDGHERRSCTVEADGVTLRITGADPREETFPDVTAAEAAASAATEALLKDGWVVAHQPDPEIARYYAEEFWRDVGIETFAKREPAGDLLERLEALHAARFPDELRQFLQVKDAHRLGYESLAEWRIWGNESWAPSPEAGNLFEQLVLLDQQNYLGTAILEYAARMVYLGSAGNGDVYFAGIDERFPNHTAVAFWDHETQDLSQFITDSVATLAYANHLLAQTSSEGELDSEALAAGMARIADRAQLSWHYRSLEEATGVEPTFRAQAITGYYYYRALPLVYLLHGRFNLNAVREVWEGFPHDKMDFEATAEGPFLASNPTTAFYWLWRLFFLGKEEQLARAITICAEAPSPLVRDMIALIEELRSGRKQLGKIEDVHALREQFQALDLDPDRAEARAREAEEAARQVAEQEAADQAQVAAWVASEGPEALVEHAWANLGNATIIDGLYAHLRAVEPSLAEDLARWDYLSESGPNNDEVRETHEALVASGDSRIVPLLLRDLHFRRIPVAAAIAGERLAAEVRRCLETRQEYNHVTEAGIQAVIALGAAGWVDDLLPMLDEFAYDPQDSIAGITGKRTLTLLIRALGESGDRRATPKLIAIAAGPNAKLVPTALVALGRLGDPAAVPFLNERLGGEHTRPALYALTKLGAEAASALPAVDAWLERLDGLPELLAYPRVMRTAIAAASGAEVDLGPVEQALNVVCDNRYDGIELHTVALGLLAEHAEAERVGALATPFLDAEPRAVREAALAALTRHDLAPALRYWDPSAAARLCDREGGAGLARELTAPGSVFRHNLVTLAVERGLEDDVRAAGEAYAREAARFEHYTYQFARDEWKRLGRGLKAAATLSPELAHWLLTHPNTMVRKVFQYHSDAIKEAAATVGPLELRRVDRSSCAPAVSATVEHIGDRPWAAEAGINGLAWTPDGGVVTAGENGARRFDADGRFVRELSVGRRWSYDVEIHPDGRLVAVGSHGGYLTLLDLATGDALATLREHGGGVRKLRFSPSGRLLAAATDDQHLMVFDVEARTLRWERREPFDVNAVDWFDEERLAFGTDKHVGVIRVGDDEPLARVDHSTADLRVFADGTRVVVGGKSVTVFDADLTPVATYPQADVARVRLSPDEQALFTAVWSGDELGVWRWDLATQERRSCGHTEAPVFGLDVAPDGTVASGGKHSRVLRFDASGEDLQGPPADHSGEIAAIVQLRDGRLLSGGGTRVIVWNLEARELERVVDAGARVNAVAASEDGQVAYLAGFESGRAIDLTSGETLWSVELGRSEIVTRVGAHVVFGSRGELVWVGAETGAVEKRAEVSQKTWLEHLAPLGDDRFLVAGYRENHFEVWDLAQRERLRRITLPPSSEKPDTCDYTVLPERNEVWVSRWDRTIQAVDPEGETPARTIQLNSPYYPIAALPNQELLAVARGDGLTLLSTRDWLPVGRVALGDSIVTLVVLGPGRLACGGKGGRICVVDLTS